MFKLCQKCGQEIFPGQKYGGSGKNKYHQKPKCDHAKAVAGKPPLVSEGATKFHSRSPSRILGSSIRRSREHRTCNACDSYALSIICPGDEYIREVWKLSLGDYWENKFMIWVRFTHYPECPIPFDEPGEGAGSAEVVVMKKRSAAPASQLRKAA